MKPIDSMLRLDTYQELASRTDQVPDLSRVTPQQLHTLMHATGLSGEAGEYLEMVKKHVFHGHPLDLEKAKKELGDALWYLASAAGALGIFLSDVGLANIDKLMARYPEGFTEADSRARVDTKINTLLFPEER